MNYYERYCGDYAKKTARLTLIQHGAYTLLLDEYYSTEQPLPADLDELYRVCRAMTKAEQEAVRAVADRFFPVLDDGLRHNERADEMIEKVRPKMEAARANGKKGGRPRKNPLGYGNGNPAETQKKPNGFPEQNPEETQDETTRARSPAPAPTPIGSNNLSGNSDGIGTNARMTPSQISIALIGWERERGKAARGINASQPQIVELSESGMHEGELRAAYDAAVADRLATNDPNPINAGFIRTFVEKNRRPQVVREDNSWKRTPGGIERKASELGVVCPPGRDHGWLLEKCESVLRQRAQTQPQGAAA